MNTERDPEIETYLRPLKAEDEPAIDLDSLFEGVQIRVREAETKPIFRLKTQPTSRRQLMAFAAFAMVLLIALFTGKRADISDYPPTFFAIYFGSLGLLFGLSLFVSLRPIHRPPLSYWQTWGLAVLSVVATCVLAITPGLRTYLATPPSNDVLLFAHAAPCMAYGFAFGLPVYLALRLLDRGSSLGSVLKVTSPLRGDSTLPAAISSRSKIVDISSARGRAMQPTLSTDQSTLLLGQSLISRLLAASAAGLAANMVLELKCPIGGSAHLLVGHAMLVVVFLALVLGLDFLLIRLAHDADPTHPPNG